MLRYPPDSATPWPSANYPLTGSGACHIQMPKQCPALDFSGAGHGVNDDMVHCRQIENDSTIAGRQAGEAMAAAPDCQ
jgi:hypothetical protein